MHTCYLGVRKQTHFTEHLSLVISLSHSECTHYVECIVYMCIGRLIVQGKAYYICACICMERLTMHGKADCAWNGAVAVHEIILLGRCGSLQTPTDGSGGLTGLY